MESKFDHYRKGLLGLSSILLFISLFNVSVGKVTFLGLTMNDISPSQRELFIYSILILIFFYFILVCYQHRPLERVYRKNLFDFCYHKLGFEKHNQEIRKYFNDDNALGINGSHSKLYENKLKNFKAFFVYKNSEKIRTNNCYLILNFFNKMGGGNHYQFCSKRFKYQIGAFFFSIWVHMRYIFSNPTFVEYKFPFIFGWLSFVIFLCSKYKVFLSSIYLY